MTKEETFYRDVNNLESSESVLILPFRYGDLYERQVPFINYMQKYSLTSYWDKDNKGINPSYVCPHVYNDLNKGERYFYADGSYTFPCGVSLASGLRLSYTSIFGDTSGEFIFDRMEIRVFSSGVGMLLLRYQYPSQVENRDIINTSANLARFFANESRVLFYVGEQQVSLVQMIRDLLHNGWLEDEKRWSDVFFFPNARKCTSFIFHRIYNRAFTKRQILLLGKLLWDDESEKEDWDSQIDGMFENEHRTYLHLDPYRQMYCSMHTMCVFSDVKELNDNESMRQQNIRNSYLNTYLITLDKHQELLRFHGYMQMVKDNQKKAAILKEHLLEYMAIKDYSVLSTEENYQNIYECYRRILNIDEMEDNINNLVFTLENEHKQRKDNLVGGALSILGLLSIYSTLEGGMNIAYMFEQGTAPNMFVPILIISGSVFVAGIYMLWPMIKNLFSKR